MTNYTTQKNIKYKFSVLSVKKNIVPTIFVLFTLCLIAFSKKNLIATKEGLNLWINNVVPSLLPFFIATELLSNTDVIVKLGKLLNPIMKPLFHIPGIGSFAFLMGIISGYPTGAKIVADLRGNNLCTKQEAERMLAFTNNSGPLFILGTVGSSMFGNSMIGFLLLITHIFAGLTVGILFRFYNYDKNNTSSNNFVLPRKNQVEFSNLGEIIGKSIMSAIKTVVIIGGFVVLFSVILSILKNSNIILILSTLLFPIFKLFGIKDINFIFGILSGILEVTNGVSIISAIPYKNISVNIIICAFLLGFGGLSVLMQVYSIISKSNISIKPYFIGKLLHGIIASIYTFIFIYFIPIFNFNI